MRLTRLKQIICFLKRKHLWFAYIEKTAEVRWLLSNVTDRICLRCGKIERNIKRKPPESAERAINWIPWDSVGYPKFIYPPGSEWQGYKPTEGDEAFDNEYNSEAL